MRVHWACTHPAVPRQVLDRNHFVYLGKGAPPSWGKEGIVPDPKGKGKTAGYHYREAKFRPIHLKVSFTGLLQLRDWAHLLF